MTIRRTDNREIKKQKDPKGLGIIPSMNDLDARFHIRLRPIISQRTHNSGSP